MPHSTSDVQRPQLSARWVTPDLLRVLIMQTVFAFGWSLYLLMPKFYATALQAGPDTIGHISAMGGVAGLLTVPFAARGLDRLGRRLLFQIGSVLMVLMALGYMHVRSIGPLVFVLHGGVSAAFVLAYNASAALLTDYTPSQRLGQAIGWLGSTNVAMNATATMVAEPLAAQFGWRIVFELGVAAGCCAFALSFFMPASAARRLQPGALGPFALAPVVGPLLASTLVGVIFVASFSFIQPYVVSLGGDEVRAFYLGFTLAVVAGRMLLGGLGDRLGRRRVSTWAIAAYGLGTLLLCWLRLDLLLVYGFIFGSAHGLLTPALNALVLEVLPTSRMGLGMVLFNGSFNLGSSIGGLAWGALAAREGYPTMYVAAALLALVPLAALLLSGGHPVTRIQSVE